MTTIDLCEKNFDVFLKEFDSVLEKYMIEKDSMCYYDAWNYDNVSLPINYCKKDSASFIESMCMVYGCNELVANKALWRCKTISDKLLNQYIHIDGISRLFNEHYIEFEWDMHSRMNFDAHEISYYRDHFFHQFRNCFMINELLNDEKVFKETESILLNENASKISRFFSEAMKKTTYNIRDEHRLKDVLEKIAAEKTLKNTIDVCLNGYSGKYASRLKSELLMFFVENINSPSVPSFIDLTLIINSLDINIAESDINLIIKNLSSFFNCKTATAKWRQIKKDFSKSFAEVVKSYYSQYIIKSSLYIAALFHDIGYPVAHYFVIQKRLLGFSPPIYMLINGDKSSYDKIFAKLSQSLLFQLVNKDEVVRRCESGDHGALSAVIFLLHFYESGLVFSLPIEQKTSIEIAAVAIYNHTNKYESILGEEKHAECNYQRAIFALNPISFLLRLCDDAQEWNRTYFEISNAASLIYCEKCHTPLIRKKEGKKDIYLCRCGESGALNTAYFKNEITDYKRRLIYNVNTCESLEMIINDDEIILRFKYDYFKLLRMCALGTSYAFQRIKELNYIKRLVLGQDIGKKVLVKYEMSCNPVFLKSLIIGKYAEKNNMNNSNFDAQTIFKGLGIEKVNYELIHRWEKQLKFYYKVYLLGKARTQNKNDRLFMLIENSDLKILVKKLTNDALLRYKDMYSLGSCSSNDYLDQYMKSDKSLKFDVDVYCDPENPINCNSIASAGELFPDYYSDLYLFELLNNKINQ